MVGRLPCLVLLVLSAGFAMASILDCTQEPECEARHLDDAVDVMLLQERANVNEPENVEKEQSLPEVDQTSQSGNNNENGFLFEVFDNAFHRMESRTNGNNPKSHKQLEPSSSCSCLKYTDVYKSGVKCGMGNEMYAYEQGSAKGIYDPANDGELCGGISWFSYQSHNYCVKNDCEGRSSDSWCYVSAVCADLNGGFRSSALTSFNVSVKNCQAGEDNFLGQLSEIQLKTMATRTGLPQSGYYMMPAMAYTRFTGSAKPSPLDFHDEPLWWWNNEFPLRTFVVNGSGPAIWWR